MQIPPCRHTGQAAHIICVKGDGFLCQSLKVRRLYPCVPIRGQEIPAQGIIHDHNCSHLSSLPASAALLAMFAHPVKRHEALGT